MPQEIIPIINGFRYSFASIVITAVNTIIVGITRISYGSGLPPGSLGGTDPQRLWRTPGVVSHRCEVEMYRHEFDRLVGTLGHAYGLTSFDISVQYAEPGKFEPSSNVPNEGVTTHELRRCRITDVDFENVEGNQPLTVRLTIDPWTIVLGQDAAGQDITIEHLDEAGVKEPVNSMLPGL